MRVACRSIYHKQDQLEKGDNSNSNTDIRTYLKTLLFFFFFGQFFLYCKEKNLRKERKSFSIQMKKKETENYTKTKNIYVYINMQSY